MTQFMCLTLRTYAITYMKVKKKLADTILYSNHYDWCAITTSLQTTLKTNANMLFWAGVRGVTWAAVSTSALAIVPGGIFYLLLYAPYRVC